MTIRQSASKFFVGTISSIVLFCLGSFAAGLSGIGAVTFAGTFQAQDKQPPRKKDAERPVTKAQGQGKAVAGPGTFGARPGGLDTVKTQIKATDEEWKVIGPKVREVIAARNAAATGMGGSQTNQTVVAAGPGGGFVPFGGGGLNPPGGPGIFGPPGGGRPERGPGGFGPPGGAPSAGGTGGDRPSVGPFLPPALVDPSSLDPFRLTAEQKTKIETLQKELETGLAKILNDEQIKQLKELPENRIGFGAPPLSGSLLIPLKLDKTNLMPDPKTQLEALQKEVGAKLAKILSEEQNKQLTGLREAIGRMGSFQPPGFGPGPPEMGDGPPLFGGGGPPGLGGGSGGDSVILQALSELQAAMEDPKTEPAVLQEKLAAVRTARTKARDRLSAAQKELLLLLTPDQEAVLVKLGYID